MQNQKWKDGIMGVIIGDALGCPVQFLSREEVAANPVRTMIGEGTYDMPAGTWTDDGSMTLATLASIRENRGINPADIMYRFALWLTKGEYTPFGESFDIGNGTMRAIVRYMSEQNISTCGGRTAHDNGNGSLMRIMPVCLFCHERQAAGKMTSEEAVSYIHQVSGLTHNHPRAKVACGLYYFMVCAILDAGRGGDGDLIGLLQKGLDEGFAFYRKNLRYMTELSFYGRLHDLYSFRNLPETEIKSGGYVVDTLEAAVWSLITTDSFRDALLTAVNLGYDTDTVGAVCGGLAGLWYGYESIPEDWLSVIQRRDWIESFFRDPDEGETARSASRYERREKNREIFRDTSRKCRDIPALADSVGETVRRRHLILEGDDLPPAPKDRYDAPAKIVVSGKRSFEAAGQYAGRKTCVLNFASALNPGGGVKNGASAQEESLCRCSTLLFTLDSPRMMTKFYLPHREADNPLYNDDIIYTPKITVFKSDADFPEMLPEEEWFEVDVLTCAAPNLRDIDVESSPRGTGSIDETGGLEDRSSSPDTGQNEAETGRISEEKLRGLLEKRVRRIFEVAAQEENEVLVLGAFGCGAFRNPPELVADVFRKVTEEYRRAFETIEYAVFCADGEETNYKAFAGAFGDLTDEDR